MIFSKKTKFFFSEVTFSDGSEKVPESPLERCPIDSIPSFLKRSRRTLGGPKFFQKKIL